MRVHSEKWTLSSSSTNHHKASNSTVNPTHRSAVNHSHSPEFKLASNLESGSAVLGSLQVGDLDSQLSAERDTAREEARTRTTADRGPTSRDTTMRSRWDEHCSHLTDQIYTTWLENLLRKKNNEVHRLPEICAQRSEMRMKPAETSALLGVVVNDSARLQCGYDRIAQIVLNLRHHPRCAGEFQHQVNCGLSTQYMYGVDAADGFGNGAPVHTGSIEDPYVPELSEMMLPDCI